jgi:tetratricopeptide (TPR) repeat protein
MASSFGLPAQPNQQQYYRKVIDAELSLSDKAFDKAVTLYEEAFALAEYAYAKDYFNAMLCYWELGNTEDAFRCADSLVMRGADLAFFGREACDGMRAHEQWELFQKRYDGSLPFQLGLTHMSEQRLDLVLKAQVNLIYELDQEFRNKAPLNYNTVYRDTINYLDTTLTKYLFKLVEERGYFPSERKVGMYKGGGSSQMHVVYIHYLVQSNNFNKPANVQWLMALLRQEMEQGNLHPAEYASLSVRASERTGTILGWTIYEKVGDELIELFIPNEEEQNRQRQALGLCTTDEARKILRFAQSDKRFILTSSGVIRQMFFDNPEDAKKHIERLRKK